MGGMGGSIYPKIYGKIYGKIYPKIYGRLYGNRTTHLGGEILKIVRNRDGRYKFDIGFLSSFISERAVPYWKMNDLGSVRVRGQFEKTSQGCRLFLFWEGLVGFFFPEKARCVFAENM